MISAKDLRVMSEYNRANLIEDYFQRSFSFDFIEGKLKEKAELGDPSYTIHSYSMRKSVAKGVYNKVLHKVVPVLVNLGYKVELEKNLTNSYHCYVYLTISWEVL